MVIAGVMMKIIMLVVLHKGALGMDTGEDNSSKRKRYIGRGGVSPEPPPKATMSPGGKFSTPQGSKHVKVARDVRDSRTGQLLESVNLFAKQGGTSPEQTKQYNRLKKADSMQQFVPFMSSHMSSTSSTMPPSKNL